MNQKQQPHIILQLGAEGGSITLFGVRQAKEAPWEFFLQTNETALLDLLSDKDKENVDALSRSRCVASWPEAIDLLNAHYPWWPMLDPLTLHPAFKDRFIAEARKYKAIKS